MASKKGTFHPAPNSPYDMRAYFTDLLDGLLSLLFPPRCEVCGLLQEPLICPRCAEAMTAIVEPWCVRCGMPFDPGAHAMAECAECRDAPPPFDAARAAGVYGGALRKAVHAFKYDGARALATPLGAFMREHIARPFPVDCLCPVPLHPKRQAMRGYNQATLLAEELAAEWGMAAEADLLARTQNTTPQIQLPRTERRANIKGAFAVTGEVEGRGIALVDDVYTTGSTLRECAQVLKRAGAARVLVLTLARAAPEFPHDDS